VIFAYFFIPQIFFYGVSSLAGGVLNARGHFAAPMWTPVINNIVVIAVLLLFIATGGIGATPASMSAAQVQLLGFGTTLGIVAQTAALIPFLRKVGFRWRPRFDFRRAEVAEIRRMAGVVFGIFSLGLVPYMMFQLMLRVFYAMHDSRTPMYIGVAVMATNIAASLLALAVLPSGHVVEGLAAAFGLANLVGTVVSWRIL